MVKFDFKLCRGDVEGLRCGFEEPRAIFLLLSIRHINGKLITLHIVVIKLEKNDLLLKLANTDEQRKADTADWGLGASSSDWETLTSGVGIIVDIAVWVYEVSKAVVVGGANDVGIGAINGNCWP
jgi:hypothetical protein